MNGRSAGVAAVTGLALVAAVVRVQDAPLDPDPLRLADGHPREAVFEVEAGRDPQPMVDFLARFPELGPPTAFELQPGRYTTEPVETRILTRPPGPVDANLLRAISEEVLRRPGVRWVTAPADRTHDRGATRALAAWALLATALTAWSAGALAAAPAFGLLAGALVFGPLLPVEVLLLPVALHVGLAVAGRSVGRLAAVALGGWAALALGVAGASGLAGAVAGSVAGGLFAPTSPAASFEGRAGSGRGLVAVALALVLGSALGPRPIPEDLVDVVPRTATFRAAMPVEAQRATSALESHGLGRVIRGVEAGPGVEPSLAVPLAAPWVEPFLADTARAAEPRGVWSAPTRAGNAPPWSILAIGGALGAAALLAGARRTDDALAGGLRAAAPALGLLAVSGSLPPGWAALAIGSIPAMVAAGALGARPAGLAVAALPLLATGLLADDPLGPGPAALALGIGLLAGALLGALAQAASPAIEAGEWPGPFVRRWAPRLAWGALVAVHLDVLLLLAVSHAPPPPEARPPGAPVGDARETRWGPNRLVRANGVFVLATEGDAYETGLAAGALGDALRVRLEDELFAAFELNVPNAAARWLITRGSAVVGMGLDDLLLPEHRRELRGDVDAAPERFAFGGPSYSRKVYYHAIHDLGQALVDTPLLGCTGFIAGPGATADGHWLLARAFDFDGGVAFDRDKVLRVHRPDGGIPFLSVSFAGIVGAVSGVNAEGVAIAINASGSDDPPRPGVPMTLIVREILERARSLDDAERVLRERAGFVSENVMVVDGDAGEAALFEVSPARVERIDVPEWLAVANHFRSPAFVDHESNAERMAELTTVARQARMERLVQTHHGALRPWVATEILEDRAAVDGSPLPRGHREALNADIATHGVVIDATTRTVRVSVYPNLSGGWVELSLDDALAGELVPTRVARAEPDAWRAVEIRRARELLRAARRQRGATALALARRAHALWPDHPEPLLERGLRELSHGDPEVGRSLLEAAARAPWEYAHQARAAAAALEGR